MATQSPTTNLVDEVKRKTVIDTRMCKQTVARETWLENYMKNLFDTSLKQVGISESHKLLKFGKPP